MGWNPFKKSKPSPAPPPPPPSVIQYPNVLTPPQNGGLDTIESYQYSEVVELLSDGPIDGLVNKNGIIVNGVNLFEGVYFNDVSVKETSDLSYECFSVFSDCLSTLLNQVLKTKKIPSSNNFNGIANVANSISINTTLSSLSFEKSIEWNSNPLSSSYDIFLASICVPGSVYLQLNTKSINLDIFDSQNKKNLINVGMFDLSQELYPKLYSENFNDFSYFEMPKSTICHGGIVKNGASTIQITPSNNGNVMFLVWGAAKKIGADFFADYDQQIIKKYLNIFAYQNKDSLYNFNSVNFEFKNGSQFQDAIQSINNIDVEYLIRKPLIGPVNNSRAVQRLNSFLADSTHRPSTNIALELEGSRDDRCVKSWPVEYDCQNSPYLICNLTMSYSHYDSTTKQKAAQKAYPYTHHVLNQNVECIYLTIGITQLFDTAHVDLASVDSSSLNTTKYRNTELPPAGVKTYGSLDSKGSATYWRKNTNPGTQGNPGSLGGNLEPTSFNFKNQQQSIAAGTKLPTIVSFKVETGYETDIDGNKSLITKNNPDFYLYQYDIFGTVQTPNTALEFGRTDLKYDSYVYASKSNIAYDAKRKHLPSYEAYDTFGGKYVNVYDTGERSVWYNVKSLKVTNPTSMFESIIKGDAVAFNTLDALTPITLYGNINIGFDVGTVVYTDKEKTIKYGNGLVLEQPAIDYYIVYEIVNSIITRTAEGGSSINADDDAPPTIVIQVPAYRYFDAYLKIDVNQLLKYENLKPVSRFFVAERPAVFGNSVDSFVQLNSILFKSFTYRDNLNRAYSSPYNANNSVEAFSNSSFYVVDDPYNIVGTPVRGYNETIGGWNAYRDTKTFYKGWYIKTDIVGKVIEYNQVMNYSETYRDYQDYYFKWPL